MIRYFPLSRGICTLYIIKISKREKHCLHLITTVEERTRMRSQEYIHFACIFITSYSCRVHT